MKNFKNILLTSLITIVVILLYLLNNKINDYNSINDLFISTQDSLRTFKNKEGQIVSTISVIEYNSKDLLELKFKDKEIENLKNLVKKYEKELSDKGSVTQFTADYNFSIEIPKTSQINNKFYYELKEDWYDIKAEATLNSLFLDLHIKNKYSVIIGERRNSLFSKKQMFVDVINENPYSEIKTLRTFSVKNNTKKMFSLGVGVNYGLSNNLNLQPNIGIGVYYNILNF